MPSKKFDWLKRVKSVEREHAAMRYAADFLLDAAYGDPTLLRLELRVRDLERTVELLEGTYIIRLFAEFESSLREFWMTSRASAPPARTRDLLDGVGAKRKIPYDAILKAHTVREFRNHLVHERSDDVTPITIADARRYLCVYLNFLPLEW